VQSFYPLQKLQQAASVRSFQKQVLLREGKVRLSFFSFSRYFVAPTDKQQQAEEKELLTRIFEELFATHF
jgi:hypothetical protein